MSLRVRDVMRKDVISVGPEMSLEELEQTLLRNRIGGAPVVEGGRVVGIVSRSDFVRQLQVERSRLESVSSFYLEPFDASERTEEDAERIRDALGARIASLQVVDVMIRDIVSIEPAAALDELARRMLERPVHRVLVIEEGALVGIVSTLDLVARVADGTLGQSG